MKDIFIASRSNPVKEIDRNLMSYEGSHQGCSREKMSLIKVARDPPRIVTVSYVVPN